MKTLQSILSTSLLLLSFNVKANEYRPNTDLNLFNPDVRKCLVESSQSEGWVLQSIYLDDNKKIVMIFNKGEEKKMYRSK